MTIKEMRQKLDMTKEMFSQRYNIPKRTIENWETGFHGMYYGFGAEDEYEDYVTLN